MLTLCAVIGRWVISRLCRWLATTRIQATTDESGESIGIPRFLSPRVARPIVYSNRAIGCVPIAGYIPSCLLIPSARRRRELGPRQGWPARTPDTTTHLPHPSSRLCASPSYTSPSISKAAVSLQDNSSGERASEPVGEGGRARAVALGPFV